MYKRRKTKTKNTGSTIPLYTYLISLRRTRQYVGIRYILSSTIKLHMFFIQLCKTTVDTRKSMKKLSTIISKNKIQQASSISLGILYGTI